MRCFVRSSLLMVTLAGTFRLMGQVSPLGGEFRVNGTTTLNQQYPAVAALSAGGFVVVWSSNVGSGTGYEINL
ncbi:MAG TPA: hypothetical protein VGR00_08110, partial [Thermoanaerobaculia bacterium]|nr:hypothetical protein [Thermoanaerobaculia bacterium]